MNKFAAQFIALLTLISAGSSMVCAEESIIARLDFGTAYQWRGMTQMDDVVCQPGIEARLGYIAFSAWGNNNLEELDSIDDDGIFT